MKKYTIVTCLSFILMIVVTQSIAQISIEFGNTSLGFTTTTSVIAPAPEAAQLADLDHDGDLDAVIANGNFNSGFSVMLNDGNGKFGTAVQYTTGFPSWDIVVADFTNDNNVDVVVSNRGDNWDGNTISLFPGTGSGTFLTSTNFTVGFGPLGVAAADFNQDSFMDLVVVNNEGYGTGTTISILMNDSSGGFLPAVTILAGEAPYKVTTGLIDNDALPDIVVANEKEEITVLLNTGSGFTSTNYKMQVTQFNNLYSNVQLADIDNDQDLDVFYSSFGTQQISMRKNLGNGVLDSIEMIVMDGWYGGASSFSIIDLNGDSLKDIVATASTGNTGDGYRIVLNMGNNTFSPEVLGSAGQYTFVVLAGDVDQDGDNDVLTLDNYSNELTVHPNNGSGTFPSPDLYISGFPAISNKLEAADIDNDGDLDIATSANSRTAVNVSVAVSKNNGNGTFMPAIDYSGFIGGVGVKLRDINNDGFADLVFASGINSSPYDFFTALNNGDGTFASLHRWPMNSCGWNDLDVVDLDKDGDLDVIVTEWLGCPSVPFSGSRIFISYNQGGGNFSAPVIKVVGPGPGPIAICDFNEDGFPDVATGQSGTVVDIHLNDGTGDLLPPVSYVMSQSPFDILATDLNDDGHVDIASCNYGSNPGDYNLTIRLGVGDGTFQNVQLIDAAYSPDLANVSGISAADVDNDGDVDLIVGQNASNDMSVYLNDGTGVFSYDHRLCVYYSFSSPWFADFDGDGKGDLAGLVGLPPSGMGSALTILPGITTGTATGGAGLSACTSLSTTISENENVENINLEIFPNPFNQSVNVNFYSETNNRIYFTILDATGRIVKQISMGNLFIGFNHKTINLSDLNMGIYFLKMDTQGKTAFKKIIKTE